MNESNKTSDNSSSMQIEPPETDQNNRPNSSLFAELQVKRDNRRTSERPAPPQNFNYGAPDEHPINLRDDLHHHPQNPSEEDIELRSQESQNTGDNSVESLAPVRSFGSGLLSYLQNWGNSFRRSPRAPTHFPEPQPQPQPQLQPQALPYPFPLYQNPVPHLLQDNFDEHDDPHDHHHHYPLPQITEAPQQEDPEELSGNTFNLFPHGALIVRTVSPGPDGVVLVRMRVIPMDSLFGDHEDDGPSPAALFGVLVRMLAGGSFMERGLDKEALESLPVVKFETEAFKNVDPESKRCTICFDDYEDGHELRYLWCLHRFHKGCVDHWLQNHTTCPVCKKDYFEAQKEDFVD